MPYCGSTTLVKRQPHENEIRALACRSWHCQDCAPRRRKRLIAEGIGGNPQIFLTLTCRRSQASSPPDAAKKLAHAWRKLRLRAIRHYRLEKLPFICVFEKHRSGWPHLHIMLRAKWLDQHWLSQQMQELLNSPVVDIRRIKHPKQVASYVSKYIAKQPHQFGTCKRYWKSQDYELREERKNKEPLPPHVWFEVLLKTWEEVCDNYRTWGDVVEVKGTRFAIARPP